MEGFTVFDNSRSIKFDEYVVSPRGNYFAGIGNKSHNLYNFGRFALFSWDPVATVSAEKLPELNILHVYPNPATDQVRFTLDGQVQVFDLLGRKVLDEQVDSQRQVAVDHLSAGLYIYTFRADFTAEFYSGKYIKQ